MGVYGNNERCTIRVLRSTTLTTPRGFSTETYFDQLSIGANVYSGTVGPAGLIVEPGTTITWSSDGSVVNGGFFVCASSPTPAPTPPPPRGIFSVSQSFPAGACYTNPEGTCVTGKMMYL